MTEELRDSGDSGDSADELTAKLRAAVISSARLFDQALREYGERHPEDARAYSALTLAGKATCYTKCKFLNAENALGAEVGFVYDGVEYPIWEWSATLTKASAH